MKRYNNNTNKGKTLLIYGAVGIFAAVFTIFFMWTEGLFNVVDTQYAPDGSSVTMIYDRDLTQLLPAKGAYTITTRGNYNETRVIPNADYEQLWWSPDGGYMVISSLYGDMRVLELKSFISNNVANLSLVVNTAMSYYDIFMMLMAEEESWQSLNIDFVQWQQQTGVMRLAFSLIDDIGKPRSGELDFNCLTGDLTDIVFND